MTKVAIMPVCGKKDLKFFVSVAHEWLLLEFTKIQNG